MRTRLSFLVAFGLWFAVVASAQDRPTISELRIPGANDDLPPQDVVRRFGSTAFRYQGVGTGSFSWTTAFFSPDGDTIYVPGSSELLALDRTTGRVRFHYRCSRLDIGVQDEGRAGVRVNFLYGPLRGQFALLEHGTGRELARGKQAVVADARVVREFDEGRRAVVMRTRTVAAQEPRRGLVREATSHLFDLASGKELANLGDGAPDASNMVLSNDRRRLAFYTDATMELRLFDTEDGRLLRSIPLGLQRGEQPALCWSEDGKTVFTGRRAGASAEIVAFDFESGDARVLVRNPPRLHAKSPVLSRDGRFLAYQHSDDPRNQTFVWKILRLSDLAEIHRVDVRPVSTWGTFSPDGESFWLLSADGVARFDLGTGKLDAASADALPGVDAMAFSSDGARLHAVRGARMIVWDVATGRETEPRTGFDELCRTDAFMRCLHIDDDGRRTLWSGGHNANETIHAYQDGRKVAGFFVANPERRLEDHLSADHRLLIHGAGFNELRLCDVRTGATVRELLPRRQDFRREYHMALAPDGRTMALVQRDNRGDFFGREVKDVDIELWNCEQGRKTGAFRVAVDSSLELQFSQDGRELRVRDRGQMSVWNVAERALVRQRPEPESSNLIAETPNRHWQLRSRYRSGGTRQIELVDVHSARTARTWDHPPGDVTAVAFSPGNLWMATASQGGAIDLRRFHAPRPEAAALRDRTVAELVDRLAHKESSVAFDALCELIRRGDDALPGMRDAGVPRETTKSVRIVEALASIRTEAAMKHLMELSKGDERQSITHEARATLALFSSK